MRIAVCYKWASNPQDAQVGPSGEVGWERAKPALSEFDPVAIAVGRQAADLAGAELIGLSAGGPETAAPLALKAALSRSLDAVWVVAEPALAHARPQTTGAVLAALIRSVGDIDLVLAGDASIDEGARMVPGLIAGHLGWLCLSGVTSVVQGLQSVSLSRTHGDAVQTVRLTQPAVLAVASDALVPPVPGMKDILQAGKKPTHHVALADLDVPAGTARVTGRRRPDRPARKGQRIDAADPARAAAELVAALRADGVL
jgi:electron transfer flavoprotein beta subunit